MTLRRRPHRRVAVPILMSLSQAMAFTEATAQCSAGSPWTDPMPIKVVLNTGVVAQICGASTCGSINDVRVTLQAALSEYYNQTAGRLRFVYDGETSVAPGTTIANRIHVFANPCNGGTLAITAWGSGTSAKIRICESNAGGPIKWNTFDKKPGGTSLHAVMLHELGHAIGMDHIEACNTTVPASIMHTFYPPESDHLNTPDINFVSQTYGVRGNEGVPRWTSNAQSWNPGGGVLPEISATGRLAASNTRTSGNNVYVGWTFGNLFLSRYRPTSWKTIAVLFFNVSEQPIYHPGVASEGPRAFVTWLGNRDLLSGSQDVLARVFDDQTFGWGPLQSVATGPQRTTNAGVSATFDPATKAFIAIWRGSSGLQRNAVTYSVIGQSPNPWVLQSPGTGIGIKASDTPSIACGPVAVVGAENCLVAWIDADHWQRPVRWTQGHVGPMGQLVLGSIKTHGFVTAGSASVAYWDDQEFPWLIALNQGGTTTYTWRKRAASSSNFEGQRSISSPQMVVLPAAGSRIRQTDGRGYVFLLKYAEAIQRKLAPRREIE